MPDWLFWLLLAWVLLSLPIALVVAGWMGVGLGEACTPAKLLAQTEARRRRGGSREPYGLEEVQPLPAESAAAHGRRRILVVDDDPALRLLLRTTLAMDEFEVEEAADAIEAAAVARFRPPVVVILDVALPGADGLSFCRQLKGRTGDGSPIVILLTGADTSEQEAAEAGADALLRKPFSPLELINLLDRLSGNPQGPAGDPLETKPEQLLLYASDLKRLLEVERIQRRLLQAAYQQTTRALADALEAKDHRTGLHAVRVQQYALELTRALEPALLDDPSIEHGFLLHDIGKIAVPDPILNKPGPLDPAELELMQQHAVVGAEILQDVAFLQGEGLRIVRSHHERWDGTGYPDQLAKTAIPLGARIFSLADTLDAMTTDRPYRAALSWEDAIEEILAQSASQFDPHVVNAFARGEHRLRRIHDEFAALVA